MITDVQKYTTTANQSFFANANNQENGVEAMHSFSVASHMSEISDLLKAKRSAEKAERYIFSKEKNLIQQKADEH